MSFHGKRILFISARFFGYENAISGRLRELGAQVDYFNERPSDSVLSKGLIRVNPNLYLRKINSYYEGIRKEVCGKHYDFFLLIKGEAIPLWFLETFRKEHPTTQMIYYSYDAVREYPKFLKLYPYFDSNFTFEPEDALNYGLKFRPLFFIGDYSTENPEPSLKYDLVFIGSAHTDRYIIGEAVRKVCAEKHLRTFFFYYAQSKGAFLLKKIFDPHLKKFDIAKLSFKKMDHSQIAEIYRSSKAVLDINKPFQNGLTMRTFETLASGKKLLTTNRDIVNYPFYHPQNIVVVTRDQPEIPDTFFQNSPFSIPQQHLEMMSLDSWIDCIFVKDQDSYWKKYHTVFTEEQ